MRLCQNPFDCIVANVGIQLETVLIEFQANKHTKYIEIRKGS